MLMKRPILYLFIGYPGAGKTTVAKLLVVHTGGVHLWADHERRRMFIKPTHLNEESRQLYDQLNYQADQLLKDGKTVIFDTNFNFYKDREHLRRIAESRGAETKLIWVTTDRDTARKRAVGGEDITSTRVLGDMTDAEFNAIADKLEVPLETEKVIKIDGTKLDEKSLLAQLDL